MRRTLLRVVASVGLVAIVLGGVAWRRPDLLAELTRFSRGEDTPSSGSGPRAELQVSGETTDDGWCAARAPDAASCLVQLPVIHLAGPDVARSIGLESAEVTRRDLAETIVGNAELTYDEHAYAEILPRVAGIVKEVHAEHSQAVQPGDVMAVIDSAEVGSAKAQYLGVLPLVKLDQSTLKRIQELTRSGAMPLKDELEATAALNRARADLLNATQRLKNLGFTDADLASIERDGDVSSLLRITCPIAGTVVDRHAVSGEAIDAQHKLVTVADLSLMWAWIDVREGDIRRVRQGMAVNLTISGLEDRTFAGEVHWIDTAVNPTTRTIRVIAAIANPDGQLRANQFGRGTIVLSEPRPAVLAPRSAVQMVGSVALVFRPETGATRYRPQRVEMRRGVEPAPGLVEITWGLEPGTRVVTVGSYLLASELLKDEEVASRLGR